MIGRSKINTGRFTLHAARWILGAFIFIALFHKFISNDIPIVAKTETGITFPVISDYVYGFGWTDSNPHLKKQQYASVVDPPISGPFETDVSNIYASPKLGEHLLGTDSIGRDVLAGLVYGAATAFKVSFFGVLIALILGLMIGLLSGYFRDRSPSIDVIKGIILIVLTIVFFAFIVTELISGAISIGMILTSIILTFLVSYFVLRWLPDYSGRRMVLHIAALTDKLIEVREAIPSIFLVLGAIALFTYNSVWNIVLVIGLISWSNISRYIRAEVLKIRSNYYVDAARVQGLSTFRIMIRHILPNALDPILAVITFSFTTAILLEATLSFLGIGMPPEQPTWGGMLAMAREANIWWLAFFPGMCIFLIIMCLNIIADNFQKSLESRM